eukprot:Ihof_evm25s1 gene=Ihof_evmTU25s1
MPQPDYSSESQSQSQTQTQNINTQPTISQQDEAGFTPSPEKLEVYGILRPIFSGWDELSLTQKKTTIGRHPSCDVLCNFPTISNEHCAFIVQHEETVVGPRTLVYLLDLSSNGTFINEVRLGKGKRRALVSKDVIGLPLQHNAKKHTGNAVYEFITTSPGNDVFEPVFGNIHITKDELGKGSFSDVRVARDLTTGKLYAAKCINKNHFHMKTKNTSLEITKEAEILRNVYHPCVIGILDFYETNSMLYILLELAQAGALFDYLIANKYLCEPQAKNFFYQMLLAMKYLHDKHITHRDLKPENVLLDHYGPEGSGKFTVKITDFGLAKIVSEASFMNTMCGTLNYVAPEVINNQPYNNIVDCWSLGVLLYICLVGYPPFSEQITTADIRDQIKGGMVQFPKKYWSVISHDAIDLVKRLLVVDPAQRCTIDEALAHPWITDDQAMIKEVDAMVDHLRATKGIDRLTARF